MLAVGEHEFGTVDNQMVRMSNGFCGGVGSTHEELCGALSAGVMIIGARDGRVLSNEDDKACLKTIVEYRQRFLERFGSSTCRVLRHRYNDCPWLIEESSLILLDVLERTANTSARGQ